MEPLTHRRAARTATVAVVAIATALAGCAGTASGTSADSDLPDVVLPALPGFAQEASELAAAELEGPAVLNFWATWCPPCRTELPGFQRASDERPEIRFLGLDEGFVAEESVTFLDEVGVTYEQFVDEGGELAADLEITELPATVVLDADGAIAFRRVGPMSYRDLAAVLDDNIS
jgi:thiol-disulfide isomerase/thioredoxin